MWSWLLPHRPRVRGLLALPLSFLCGRVYLASGSEILGGAMPRTTNVY